MIDEQSLRAHHVADRHHRHIQPIGLARGWIGGGWPRRAEAAPEHIRANDEIAVRIDRLARTNHNFPPARLAG